MARVKHAVSSKRRKKRVLKQAKGQFAQRSKRYQQALRSVRRSMVYAYRDRRVKKREFKSLWIIRIKAACQESGMMYSRFMNGLKNANIAINRKVLADLAVSSPESFRKLVQVAKLAKQSPAAKVA